MNLGSRMGMGLAAAAAFLLSADTARAQEITPGASAVTASTHDGNVPGNVVDNNLGTRWSASGDGQWLQLDLGTVRSVGSVRIAWYNGNLRSSRFDLQLSSGSGVWTTAWSGASNGTSTLEQTFDFPDADARYVRYLGHGNTVNLWNSVTEISIFAGGSPTATATPTVRPTVRPTSAPTATPTQPPSGGGSFEAEAGTVSGAARVSTCSACSGGSKVGFIGNGTSNYVTLNGVSVSSSGTYSMRVYGLVSGTRSFSVSINGGGGPAVSLTGTSFSTVTSVAVNVTLMAGSNTVRFFNNTAYAPDLDRIVISTPGSVTPTPTPTPRATPTARPRVTPTPRPRVRPTPTPGGTWRQANLTNFESYPDPNSDECVKYNGCLWAGQFAYVSGKQTEAWVRDHNIAAVHEDDGPTYRLKTLRLRQSTRQIDVTVYDICSDSDCSGCCTRNANANGLNFLIDIEKYTMQRFGSGSGIVDWQCLNCN